MCFISFSFLQHSIQNTRTYTYENEKKEKECRYSALIVFSNSDFLLKYIYFFHYKNITRYLLTKSRKGANGHVIDLYYNTLYLYVLSHVP